MEDLSHEPIMDLSIPIIHIHTNAGGVARECWKVKSDPRRKGRNDLLVHVDRALGPDEGCCRACYFDVHQHCMGMTPMAITACKQVYNCNIIAIISKQTGRRVGKSDFRKTSSTHEFIPMYATFRCQCFT